MAAGVDPRTVAAGGVNYNDTLADGFGGRVLTPQGFQGYQDQVRQADQQNQNDGLATAAKMTAAVFGGAALMGPSAAATAPATVGTTGTATGASYASPSLSAMTITPTVAAPTAGGVAGMIGMSPGLGATVVNKVAMNAGMKLATGSQSKNQSSGYPSIATPSTGGQFSFSQQSPTNAPAQTVRPAQSGDTTALANALGNWSALGYKPSWAK